MLLSKKNKASEKYSFILHACDVSSAAIPFTLEQSSTLSQTFSNGIHFPDDVHLKYSSGHVTLTQSNGSSAPSSKILDIPKNFYIKYIQQ
jgi:hypothetical protein